MNFKMRWQLARKNLIANKIFNVPFVISSSLLLGIFYILLSLLSNDYVQHRHPALPQLLSLAAIVIAILSVIFIFYGNNFTMKNRNQELGLYGILGLEKKHIAGIFFLESFILYIITFLCALINGFILGKLSFLTLNYLVKDYTSSLQNYSFDSKAALITLLLTTGIFILLFIITIFKIGLSSPMQLFNKQKSGEKPPKSNKLIGILGIILIGIGYFLAIHQKALPLTQSNISLLIRNFFIAVLFVISGTYLTFISGSILILKSFQKRKNYYYKPKNFLFINGMLKRMSSNAIGLASITVLSTGIILSLVTPLTAAMGLTQITKEAMARDYSASLHVPLNQKIASTQEFEKLTDKLKQQVLAVYPKPSDIKNMNLNVSTMIPGNFKDNKFITIDPTNLDNISYFIIETVDQTNALYHDNHKLKANEIMVASNHISAQRFFSKKQKVEFMGQKFTALPLGHLVANQDALNAYRIIVPNWETLVKAANYYNNYQESKNDESRALASAEISLNWDSKLNLEQNSHYLSLISDHTIDQQPIITTTTIDIKNSIYEMNGGIIFIGLLIGISLLVGNILIIVYKQFSEGFEDRADFKIMKNVGLTPQLINQTSRKQILWLFFLPLIIASIHALASSNIIFMLLHLFGVNDFFNLMQNFGIVMASFTVIYILVFAITSKLYVKIVK